MIGARGWSGLAPLGAVACMAFVHVSAAQDRPTSKINNYSKYEQATIQVAEKELKSEVDPTPDGKIVEAIDVLPLDIFEERDLVPRFFNVFHATTRKFVIEREVLLRVGEKYDTLIADETARNLRRLPQLSVVIVTAFKGSAPDRVRLVVLTKDLWSLRLNIGVLTIGSSGLEQFSATPSESNLLGTHQRMSVAFGYLPRTYTFGLGYAVPRLFGTRMTFSSSFALVLNKASGDLEGTSGSASVSQPLYTTWTKWAWVSATSWSTAVLRHYVGSHLATYDAKATPEDDRIPDEYKSRSFTHSLALTRSFGWRSKTDLLLGAEADVRRADAQVLSGVPPAALLEFVRVRLPRSDMRVGPFVQLRWYRNDFLRVLNHETFALQEDVSLGYDFGVRVYPITELLGSSRTFLGTFTWAQYTASIGQDGFVRASVENRTEAEASRVADGALSPSLRLTTPHFSLGRFVLDGTALYRYRNSLNHTMVLGGTYRPRGYPTGLFAGTDMVLGTAEFRTQPLELLSAQLGGVLFYDLGDAPTGLSTTKIHHSAGFGARALLPWLDRVVFRADFGFALERPLPGKTVPMEFLMTFGQAFDVRAAGPTTPYLGQ